MWRPSPPSLLPCGDLHFLACSMWRPSPAPTTSSNQSLHICTHIYTHICTLIYYSSPFPLVMFTINYISITYHTYIYVCILQLDATLRLRSRRMLGSRGDRGVPLGSSVGPREARGWTQLSTRSTNPVSNYTHGAVQTLCNLEKRAPGKN